METGEIKKACVIVIGGGVMGLSVSWRLAQAGYQVTVITNKKCGEGATSASLGALMPYNPWHKDDIAHRQWASLKQYPFFVRDLITQTGIDPGYRTLGRIQWLSDTEQYKKYAPYIGHTIPNFPQENPFTFLTPDMMQKHYPDVEQNPYGAIFCKATAHIMPRQLISALRAACLKLSVDIIENCQVHQLEYNGRNVTSVHTSHGRKRADFYVASAGAWSDQLFSQDVPCIQPVKGEALLLQASPQGTVHRFPHLIRGRGVYVIPLDYGKFFVGATKKMCGFDESLSVENRDTLLAKAESMLPFLSETKVSDHWCGFRPIARDKTPLCGLVNGSENLLALSGHGGIGMSMAPGESMGLLAEIEKIS